MSIEIRPSIVYVLFGYFASSAGAFIIAEATGGKKDPNEEDDSINSEVQGALLILFGICLFYVFAHVLENVLSAHQFAEDTTEVQPFQGAQYQNQGQQQVARRERNLLKSRASRTEVSV